ncbi:hypothetical protein Tco_0385811 [Tanacetum coccineum]
MDDPNITMEEYIRLEEEKAQRHGRTFNWQTATFRKVKYYEDEDDCFPDFETEFLTIIFDNTLKSDTALPCEPTVSPPNENKIDFRISLDESDDEDYTIWRLYLLQIRDTHGSGFSCETEDGLHWGDGQQLGGVRRRMTWRQFILALGLHTKQEMAEAGDFLGPAPFFCLKSNPVRNCAQMITYSISGRGQAPKKVTGVDLFYLRSMDRGTANVPHLLTQHLFWHAEGRKNGATLSGGHFIGRLATYFGLVSDEGLRAPGPERQQANAAGAPAAAEGAPTADEGAQAVSAPVQAPQPPPPAPQPRTMS